MTITNANYDDKSLIQAIKDCNIFRDNLKLKVEVTDVHPSISWAAKSDVEFNKKAKEVGTLDYDSNKDIRGHLLH